MLNKLRSRHPVDIPAEGFGRSRGLLTVLGGIAVLAVIIPVLLAIAEGAFTWAAGVAIGVGVIILAFIIMGAIGVKPGYRAVGRGRSR